MRFLSSPILIAALMAFGGCGRTPEALIARQISILDQTAETLATISDEASAEAAAPKLARLRGELNALVPRVKSLNLSAEQQAALEEEHREDMQAALAKYEAELDRVLALNLNAGGLSDLKDAVAE